MSIFEYSSVLLSVIIGLAITKLLNKLSTLLREQDCFKRYWVQIALIISWVWMTIAIFFTLFIFASDIEFLSLSNFVFSPFITTTLLFFIADFSPVPEKDVQSQSLNTYFVNAFPRFFIVVLLWLLHIILLNISNLGFGGWILVDPAFYTLIGGVFFYRFVKNFTFRHYQLLSLAVMPLFYGGLLLITFNVAIS